MYINDSDTIAVIWDHDTNDWMVRAPRTAHAPLAFIY